ncbi:MAG TPA: diguanylate cyclase [Marinospirillum sp.]|uniref:diguanylate cyclase domain-containing protein n=1 Tax=Marinospirillum sp. TaxID=2183934 RepID=UPI002B49C753|nr:diguanylate cyclase [Marinospirillum sp.]HKM15240.1 diguanylate cyclase [Marinospirillum sp.]
MNFAHETHRIALIRKRILLIALMGVLATGLVASLSTSIPFYYSARNNLEQITLTGVRSQASVIDNLLDKYQDLAQQFTGRTEIRVRLERYHAGNMSLADVSAFSEPRLKEAMNLSDELLGLVRLGVKGEVLARIGQTPATLEEIITPFKNFPVSKQDGYTFVQLNGLLIVRVDANIFSKEGDLIGQDILYFNGLKLIDVLNDRLQLNNKANVYLANLVNKKRLSYNKSNKNFVLVEEIDSKKMLYLSKANKHKECTIRPDSNCKNIIFIIPLVDSNWSLVAEIPVNSFYSAIRQQVLWPLLAIIFMLGVAAFAISKALHPLIRRLTFQTKELEHSTEELRLIASVFEGTREAIAVTDAKMHLIKVNSAFSQITGFAAEDVLGKDLQNLFYKKKAIERLQTKIQQSLEVKDSWQGEIWYQHKNSELLPVLQSISALLSEDGQVINYIHIFNDISESKANEERINYLAHYDQLTGLPNRTLLNRRIRKAVDKALNCNQSLAILFMDLDHFKEVNDTLGHPVGDLLLQAVGQRLKAILREQDTLGRLGGDEFLAILDHSAKPDASSVVAEKIISALTQSFMLAGHEIKIGVSIGIAIYPKDGCTVDELVKNADIAMYRAKESGRNTFRYFSEAEDL